VVATIVAEGGRVGRDSPRVCPEHDGPPFDVNRVALGRQRASGRAYLSSRSAACQPRERARLNLESDSNEAVVATWVAEVGRVTKCSARDRQDPESRSCDCVRVVAGRRRTTGGSGHPSRFAAYRPRDRAMKTDKRFAAGERHQYTIVPTTDRTAVQATPRGRRVADVFQFWAGRGGER
jgi:hypothetical protein